jgi:peptide subunit release factor 1 (eRF1)
MSMIEDFLYKVMDITCPECGFVTEVTLSQVVAEETVICLGCRSEIQLCDEGGSVGHTERELRQLLQKLQLVSNRIKL